MKIDIFYTLLNTGYLPANARLEGRGLAETSSSDLSASMQKINL